MTVIKPRSSSRVRKNPSTDELGGTYDCRRRRGERRSGWYLIPLVKGL
jgi:hypothetical protein